MSVFVWLRPIDTRAISTLLYTVSFVLPHPQIAQDCNESVKRGENELKLYSITRRFPNDEVVRNICLPNYTFYCLHFSLFLPFTQNVIVSRGATTIKERGKSVIAFLLPRTEVASCVDFSAKLAASSAGEGILCQ